jgi:hypothetical protein
VWVMVMVVVRVFVVGGRFVVGVHDLATNGSNVEQETVVFGSLYVPLSRWNRDVGSNDGCGDDGPASLKESKVEAAATRQLTSSRIEPTEGPAFAPDTDRGSSDDPGKLIRAGLPPNTHQNNLGRIWPITVVVALALPIPDSGGYLHGDENSVPQLTIRSSDETGDPQAVLRGTARQTTPGSEAILPLHERPIGVLVVVLWRLNAPGQHQVLGILLVWPTVNFDIWRFRNGPFGYFLVTSIKHDLRRSLIEGDGLANPDREVLAGTTSTARPICKQADPSQPSSVDADYFKEVVGRFTCHGPGKRIEVEGRIERGTRAIDVKS